jgi:hypothetical protein
LGAAEPRYVLQSPGLVESCVGLYVPLLEFNQIEKQLGIISGNFAEETDRQAYRELANEALAEIWKLEAPFHDERFELRQEASALYSATKDQDGQRFLGQSFIIFWITVRQR